MNRHRSTPRPRAALDTRYLPKPSAGQTLLLFLDTHPRLQFCLGLAGLGTLISGSVVAGMGIATLTVLTLPDAVARVADFLIQTGPWLWAALPWLAGTALILITLLLPGSTTAQRQLRRHPRQLLGRPASKTPLRPAWETTPTLHLNSL